jgi:predicted metal-dependent hydrolase
VKALLKRIVSGAPAPLPEAVSIEVGGGCQRVVLRRNARAQRYILRVPSGGGDPVMTVPAKGTLETALRFAESHRGWLEKHLTARPDPVAFAAGGVVPVRGVEHRIEATGRLRGLVSRREDGDEPVLVVPGGPDHLARRLTDWLRREARADLEAAVARHAGALGRSPAGIALRDTRSRWGSCSASGQLSFSWRLVLAPPTILDYVAAHEVAHLAEMNHGPRFWAHCRRLAPQTDEARDWLRREGGRLHLYG